jgi:hypothetical protein
MERSEEAKLFHEPIKVILGGEEYDVAPLVIRDSRIWRGKIAKLLGSLPRFTAEATDITTDNPAEFEQTMSRLMEAMPDTIIDLFFDYAKGLNREEIEKVATETEIAEGFTQIMEIAFPLARSLARAMERMSQ